MVKSVWLWIHKMAGPADTEDQCPEPGATLAHSTQFTLAELYTRCEILPHIEGTPWEQTYHPILTNQGI